MDAAIISRIAHEVSLPEAAVTATVGLFEKGNTAPFVLHYRKEVTGGLDETKIRAIQERYIYYREVQERRSSILKLIADQGKLTDNLRARIQNCLSRVELEDLYHQFRPKKRTRALEAIEKGLEPLAEYLWNQEPDAWSLQEHIDVFVDPAKKVASREQALQGATEIISQWIAENMDLKMSLREMLWNEGSVVSTVVPAKAEQKTKYNMYYNRREPVTTIPSHRVLAIRRGSKEGILTTSIEGSHTKAIEYLLSQVIREKDSVFAPILEVCVRESYNRILRPLIETEVRAQLKERADREAIRVFQENLANLLLSPPAGQMVVAGLDTVKSGECTLAVVDERGKLLEDRVIRFSPPKTPPARITQAAEGTASLVPDAVKPTESPAPAVETAPVLESTPDAATLNDAAVTVTLVASVAALDSNPPAEPSIPLTAPGTTALMAEVASEAAVEAFASAVPDSEPAAGPDTSVIPVAIQETAPGSVEADNLRAAPELEAVARPMGVAEVGVPAAVEATPETMPAAPAEPIAATDTILQVGAETSAQEVLAPVAEQAAGGQASNDNPTELGDTPPPGLPAAVDHMAKARVAIREIISKHSVRAIAIGAGTGARELETTLRQILADEKIDNVLVAAVNDAGIAVYSSSRVAREELPNLSVSARCAVSLARRLQDPLTEMVKIDPKLIGVGQYQHDVDQKELHRGLLQTVQFCVNKVGVDVNAAGYSLLRYVAGLNDRLSHRIVAARNAGGPFSSRQALLKVPGFDSATFDQAAGFLRIRGGENPLDATAIHPESYQIVEKMAASLSVGIADLIGNKELVSSLNMEEFAGGSAGPATLADIREELLRPGRDPRRTFALPKYRSDVKDLNDLKTGMTLEGTVTNVTNFGAFIDIGVHQDGLVHLSQMSNRFIRDPREAVKVGDVVQVKVISVEAETKRIGLSMKALLPSGGRRRRKARRPGGEKPLQPEATTKPDEGSPAGVVADKALALHRPERRGRRERDRGRPRRRESRRPDRPAQNAAPDLKPEVPEPSLQEKIAILQSKFRGIN